MDGCRTGSARGLENRFAAKVTVLRTRPADVHRLIAGGHMRGLRIRVGKHGHGANAHAAGGARETARDLAAIRYEDLAKHRDRYFFGSQAGARFSRNAAIPSRPSGDTR